MDVKIRRTIDFVPKWRDNDKDDNPIVFLLKYLTSSEYDDCFGISPAEFDDQGKKITGGEVTIDRKKMFLAAVTEILNFNTVDERNEKMAIKTGQDMLDCPGTEDLFFEIITFIRSTDVEETDSKN